MTENPYSPDLINWLVASGQASELWPQSDDDRDGTAADDMIYELLIRLGWDDEHQVFLDALAAGHTSADAARLAQRSPAWGRARLREIRDLLSDK